MVVIMRGAVSDDKSIMYHVQGATQNSKLRILSVDGAGDVCDHVYGGSASTKMRKSAGSAESNTAAREGKRSRAVVDDLTPDDDE